MTDKKPKKIDAKKISAKDIIYAEIDDEITTLVDRLRRSSSKELYLVVPQHAMLFQSIVNLRILAAKADEMKKSIFIVTADRRGRKLSTEAGLSMVEKLEGVSYAPRNFNPSLAITPLKKKKDAKEQPKRIQKIAIAEILEAERKETGRDKVRNKFEQGRNFLKEKSEELNLSAPNKKLFIGIFSAIVLLFIGILYIALPSASVRVQPAANLIEKTVNLVFTDATINPAEVSSGKARVVPVYPVETTFEKTLKFNATEKIFTGSSASGWINVYNESAGDWLLIGGTRFQTDDGVVFRIPQQISVPGAVENEEGEIVPGELKVRVNADDLDAYNDVTGDRGNIINGTYLKVPGLSEYNQRLVYGEAAEDFQGGVTDYYTIISENDMNAAKEFTLIEIEASAKEELARHIEEKNETMKRELILFDNPKGYEKEVLEVNLPEDLIGTEGENFEVSARMHVSGLAYDRSAMLSILERELRSAVHPDKKLVSLNTDGITLNPLEDTYNQNTGKITVVGVIEGVEEWSLDPSTAAGKLLIEKIKTHTMGKSVIDAENYVRNLREIRDANVAVWPFWAKTLPTMSSAINIDVIHN